MQFLQENGSSSAYICWTDRLSLFSWLKILQLSKKYSFEQVFYFSANGWLLDFARKWPWKRLKFEAIELGRKEISLDDTMESLKRFTIQEEKKPSVKSFSGQFEEFFDSLHCPYPKDKLRLFFDQRLFDDFEISMTILEQACQRMNFKSIVFVLSARCFMAQLKELYKQKIDNIETYVNVREVLLLFAVPFKIWLELFINGLAYLVFPSHAETETNTNPKIAVLYSHGVNLNRRCDFFWWPESGIPSRRILLYFKHFSREPTPSISDELERAGIPWLNLLPLRLKLFSSSLLELNKLSTNFYIKKLWTLCLFSFRILKVTPSTWKWFALRWMLLADDTYFFESFFRSHNIKIHYGVYETGRHMTATNLAIGALGGVDLCHHWSSYDVINPIVGKPHDVYFTWGSHYTANFSKRNYYQVDHFVSSGYCYDYMFEPSRLKARIYRQQLEEKGANRIIAFLDQISPGLKSGWNKKHEKIYKALLEYVLKNVGVGLILKPKKIKTFDALVSFFPSLSSLFLQAKFEGRLLFVASDNLPTEAIAASDLVVGIGTGSTPIVEAALLGIPCVSFDIEYFADHPLFAQGHHRVIFTELSEMIQKVHSFLKGEAPNGFANFSSVIDINDVDPFHDGQASRRIGSYLKVLLDNFDKGELKNEAIHGTNQIYTARYGNDKIVSKSSAIGFSINEEQFTSA